MANVRRMSAISKRPTLAPVENISAGSASGYFGDTFEAQIAKKPSILVTDKEYENMASPHALQGLLDAYWDRVHILHPYLHRPTWHGKQKAEEFIQGTKTFTDITSRSIMATCMANMVLALGALNSPSYTTAHALNTSETFFLSAKEILTLDHLETPSLELAQNLLLMTQYAIERCHHQRGHLHASLLYLSLAIRVCTALGLHEDSGATQGPLIREISRRVWWECIYTDMWVALFFFVFFEFIAYDYKSEPSLPITPSLCYCETSNTSLYPSLLTMR